MSAFIMERIKSTFSKLGFTDVIDMHGIDEVVEGCVDGCVVVAYWVVVVVKESPIDNVLSDKLGKISMFINLN